MKRVPEDTMETICKDSDAAIRDTWKRENMLQIVPTHWTVCCQNGLVQRLHPGRSSRRGVREVRLRANDTLRYVTHIAGERTRRTK